MLRVQTKSLHARRWMQWSLRSMLLLTTVSALMAGFVLAPRFRERAALDWLHEVDAHVTTEILGPGWLTKVMGEKYLQSAVAVDLINHDLSDDDIRRLGALRRLRQLDLSGNSLTDESAAALLRLSQLEELGLARTDITDAGLARLADLPGLARLRVAGSKVTLAAADRLAGQKSDLQLDAALGDALYQETWYLQTTYRERNRRPLSLRELVFRCQTAGRWKAACARLSDNRDALAEAHQQQIHWLKKYLEQTGGPSRAEPPLGVEGETAWLECLIADADIALAQAIGHNAGEKTAQERRVAAARRLVALMSAKLEGGPIHPFEFESARETATRILLAEGAADLHRQESILVEEVEQYGRLAVMTRHLYEQGMRGGEAVRMALVEIDLALARWKLARLRGGREDEKLALKDATALAKDAREAAEASYNAGTLTVCELLQVNRRAEEIEIAYARVNGNPEAEQAAALAAETFFSDTWLKVSTLAFHNLRWAGGDLVRCLYGIELIEQRGAGFYEGPVRALEPLADIPRRRVISQDADRAIEVARSYLEKQRREPVNASLTVCRRGDGYGISVEFLDRHGQPSRLGGHCLIVVSKDWEVSRYIAGE